MKKSELNIGDQEHFDKVYEFAKANGVMREFIKGVNYLATYSESYEHPVKVNLFSDRSAGEYSFVASIYRWKADYDWVHEKMHYKEVHIMTIGMVWNEREKRWTFHS